MGTNIRYDNCKYLSYYFYELLFMNFYFSSKHISELAEFTNIEKRQILAIAFLKMTTPEKLVINLIKLGMLIPPFLLLANLKFASLAASLVVVFLAYLLIMRPISLAFAKNHITKAIAVFKKEQEKP